MKNQDKMLDLFQVEELENRYEMGWLKLHDPSEVGAVFIIAF